MFGKGKIAIGKISLNLNSVSSSTSNQSSSEQPGNQEPNNVNEEAFGKFGSKISSTEVAIVNETEENEPGNIDHQNESEMSAAMGFSSFGKPPAKFDIDKMLLESKKIAQERNRERLEKLQIENETPLKTDGPNKTDKIDEDSDSDSELMGPPLPPGGLQEKDEDEEDDEAEEEDKSNILPISHELLLSHGDKSVTALAVDPSGSRLVSGAVDYYVKYWDFQGMDLSKEAFRSFKPSDGYPINSVDYSCTGDKVLVVSGSTQAKVYNRDGVEVFETVRGDMYLHDMAKSKGHISGCTDGKWHPKNKEEFLTSGRDGTCRLWYTSRPLQQVHVIKPRTSNGLKAHPISCNFSRDGNAVACAANDGSIQMWDHRKHFVNTSLHIQKAHDSGTETSCISFSYDGKHLASRGGDETLKLWDLRNKKVPIFVVKNLFSKFAMTDCLFSPNDKFIATGTSLERGEKAGKLKLFDRTSGNLVKDMEIGTSHLIKILWHPRLNQIMLGCGDGHLRVMYDPSLSRNGAIFVAGKRKKKVRPTEEITIEQVITPHALPLFREDRHRSSVKNEEKDRKNPMKSHQPELPVGKAGSGGRVSTGGSTLSSYIIRNMGIRNKAREEENPREALLRHAKEASDNPYWVSPAYAKNQPKPIFQPTESDTEGHQAKKQKKE